MRKLIIIVLTTVIFLLISVVYLMNERIETIDNITIEAGESIPDVSSFIVNQKYIGTYDSSILFIDSRVPNTYDVGFQFRRNFYESTLTIQDTTSPTGQAINHEIWLGESIELNDFIKNSSDLTHLTVSYKTKPDFKHVGHQTVEIVLMDTSDNETILTPQLSIKKDSEAPVITGIKDIHIYIGDPIAYKRGVKVTDNRDVKVELVVNNSLVNSKAEGKYPTTYTATDQAGNITTESCYVTVDMRPEDSLSVETVNELADKVLDQIIKPDMTEKEELWTIYKWIRNSIEYTGYSNKSIWLSDAARGIKTGSGDCFTYYAVARALLERSGYETFPVTRLEVYPSRHYWVLVKFNGGWYHYDTCPALLSNPYWCFLKTDEEIAAYTELVKDLKSGYYDYDNSILPEVSTIKIKRP